ncbi:DUF4350 domain-containing protein [Nocardioides sp. zg-536]|uniref:DUF4350 domain-containing protein n=1 Tax=Nocardioides faecalis TaxID=2803858 RepID=A0A938Y7J6_9ACTN|nr:DUF4350 domain-containing protein [Nocardioides faecalis]MBM9459638.1 DUF4350 domain-containing protein [Nocardioides faecalis]QVI58164.1 DUF4350 domain-containing protein [Nocardioides faecalis]
MSALGTAGTQTGTGSQTPSGGAVRRWLRRWGPIVLALVLALGAALWTARGGERWPDPLDPRNPGPQGSQALAEVLAELGVEVDVVRSADALDEAEVDAATTVVTTRTEALAPSTYDRLREAARPGHLVVVDPDPALTESLDLRARRGTGSASATGCAPSLADLRLDVDTHTSFTGPDVADRCFITADGAVLVELDAGDGDGDDSGEDAAGGRVSVFGAGEAFSNDQVLRGDNAAIGLRLLGGTERLVWYVPDPADATAAEAPTLTSLLPEWIGPGLWLGAIALLAVIGWRFRRLGPLSTEPLPVVVRAVETAHSRGRLYRRSGDLAHSAAILRRAARADLAERLRLDPHADAAAVAEAAAREVGRPAADLLALLDESTPPSSERDLVRLAESLTRWRREVRRR